MVALRCLPAGKVPAQRARTTWLQDRLRNALYTNGEINPRGVAGGHVFHVDIHHVDLNHVHIHDVHHDEADDDLLPQHVRALSGSLNVRHRRHPAGAVGRWFGAAVSATGCRRRSGTRRLSSRRGTVGR
jgi:hypothetical protein